MPNSTILVTGGAGYIGSACVKALCDSGHTVVTFDNLSRGSQKYIDDRALFVEGDILDEKVLAEVFRVHRPHVVVHAAALKSVAESEVRPEQYFQTNVCGTLNVLVQAAKNHTQQIIFSSTAAVYTQPENGMCDEKTSLGPMNVYGTSKMLAEKLIIEFARTGKISTYIIFRYFNVAGDVGLRFTDPEPHNIFPVMARTIYAGTPFTIFGDDYPTPDGTCIRDYIHLADLVDAHLCALSRITTGIFNLGTGTGYSVRELMEGFERAAGNSLPKRIVARRNGDPAQLVACSTRAREELGWTPTHSLDDMITSTLHAYRL